jgi:prepilin-type N-terminal cleavage/methylation domain-containing protein
MRRLPRKRSQEPFSRISRTTARDGRRGFTLLEVLVALSLSVLLIGAVYSGLNLYWRYSTAGQADVERAQLARALLRRIELDVRTVMYRPPAPTASSASSGSQSPSSGSGGGSGGSGGSGSGGGASGGSGGSSGGTSGSGSSSSSSGSSSTSTDTTTPDDAYGTATTGLYGNATTLLMNVNKPGRERKAAALMAAGNPQTRVSDLATVVYFVGGTAGGALQQATTMPGLARLEGDRLALSMADQQSNTAAMAAATEILASEVIALRFMYYDGFYWRSDWDSKALGGLPKAIDVEMALRPLPSNSRSGAQSASTGTPNVYRLVIAIPLAKPMDTSTITTSQ